MARDPYKYFRVEAREIADQLGQGLLDLERTGSGGDVMARLLRLAHTLKGAARVVRQPEIAEHAHAIEDALAPYRELAGIIPREHIDPILRLVDVIARQVAELQLPATAAVGNASPSEVASRPAVEESIRSVSANVAEIDDLLDNATEAYAQVGALRDTGKLADKAQRLADLIAKQISAAAVRESGSAETARLARFAATTDELRGIIARLERSIAGAHDRIDRELRQVRDGAEQLRLVPAGAMFSTLARAARDSAHILGKQVAFESQGGEVRLDGHVVRVVQDALIQMVRNAVAHGIEATRDRIAARKPEAGRVLIEAVRRGRHVIFRCTDDGGGIDVAALRQAAIRKGRAPADLDNLDARGVVQALLQGGISTSAAVNEVAGRGIGMDIVRDAAARLAGEFVVETAPGIGTTLELIIPLSVSSAEALIVESAGITATIPLEAVRHAVRLEPSHINRTAAGEAIVHNGGVIPLVLLATLLGKAAPARHAGGKSAIIIGAGTATAALCVDRLIGTSNIVFRSLPKLAPVAAIIAGASLNSDGSPLLMLDAEGLVATALRASDPALATGSTRLPVLVIDDSLTTRMLEQSILESAGYEVHVAVSAEEALEQARAAEYALFLVDVEMPGMDGFSFIEQIRRDPKLHNVPAILVTSLNTAEHRRRGTEVGAQGYVVKSEFNQAELLRHIEQLVN